MRRVLLLAAVGLAVNSARAFPLIVNQLELPAQDDWLIPERVHEVGVIPAFAPYPEETITSETLGETSFVPCPANYFPGLPNMLVRMVNTTGNDWKQVYYVADGPLELTFVSNFDELVGEGFPWLAFKIDSVGENTPLVFESIAQDNIWEAGEEWRFVLQNYFNSWDGPPSAFGSLHIASLSVGDRTSTGSILVPEPAWGFVAMALAALGAVEARRRLR
jgi:hypothetical protein